MKWSVCKRRVGDKEIPLIDDTGHAIAIQSGVYRIARQGKSEVSYMLSRIDMPLPLGHFMTSDEAKQAAADDHMLFGGA